MLVTPKVAELKTRKVRKSCRQNVWDILLTRPCFNTKEISHSFFKGNRAWFIILIHPSEHIWVYRTASSSQIINISLSVSKGGEELDKDRGQLCYCGGSIENAALHKMCNKQKSNCLVCFWCFWIISMQIRNRHINTTTKHCRGNREYNIQQSRLKSLCSIQQPKRQNKIHVTLLLIR